MIRLLSRLLRALFAFRAIRRGRYLQYRYNRALNRAVRRRLPWWKR